MITTGLFPHNVELLVRTACPEDERWNRSGTLGRGDLSESCSHSCKKIRSQDDNQVYRLMGYDSEKREIKMGMLAEKTHPYIRDKVSMAIRIKIIQLKWDV